MQSSNHKEEFNNEEYLASMSTVFGMNAMSNPQDFANMVGPSSLATHTHSRSISSDSASSLVDRTQLPRTHPSLQGYNSRGSPNGQHHQDLPPQDRRYLASAAPAPPYTRARRRATPPSEDEDEYPEEPLNPNATEQERAEYKRRQNTLAARRSRRRRMAQFHKLEEDVARLNRERDIWKERALMMERMLATHGLPCPNFSER